MRALHRRPARRAFALAIGVLMMAGGGHAQNGDEDGVLLRIGGAAENGDPARFDATLAEWRAAGRFSLAALERKGVLHAAVESGGSDAAAIVMRVLGLRADLDARNIWGQTPLHWAASHNAAAVLSSAVPPLSLPIGVVVIGLTEVRVVDERQLLGRPVVKLSVGSPEIGTITLRDGVAAVRDRLFR
jgi:hypothetical protein